MQAYLKLDHIDKSFTRGNATTEVLKEIHLTIDKGEYVSIIGHSGCGKSTLLNIVAGLTNTTNGCVLLENREVNSPGPDRAVVFQNHSLLPWLTVYENVKLGVDKVFSSSKSRAERHAWVMHNLNLVQMAHAADKPPAEISGGRKQLVGLARALAMEPKILLLDEPFGALDNQTRGLMQELLLSIWESERKTVLFVTHDIEEAIFMANRVVVMTARPGRIKADVPVALPHPRHYTLKTTPEFSALKARLTEDIRVEALKVAALAG